MTNGIRCVITKLSANSIEAKISHGIHAGHEIIIPQIPLIPSNSLLYLLSLGMYNFLFPYALQ